jgi:hypothetical protein
MQQLSVNASISGLGSGFDVNRVYSKAEQSVRCEVINVTATRMVVIVPKVAGYLLSYSELLRSDWLFTPGARFSTQADLVVANGVSVGVTVVPSPLANSGGKAFEFSQSEHSYVSMPFEQKNNEAQFAVDLWLQVTANPGAAVPIIRSLGKDGSGYAFMMTDDGRCQFLLGTGLSSDELQPTFSVLDAACSPSPGRLMHVALTFDGMEQIIFVDGEMVNATKAPSFKANTNGKLYLGGNVNGGSYFEGTLSEILIYPVALSPSCVRGHARFVQQILHASFHIAMSGFQGKCAGDCSLQLLASSTPKVFSIYPDAGWTGTMVTITGQGFTLQQDPPQIRIGSRSCSMVLLTNSTLECTIEASVNTGDKLGLLPVTVEFASLGRTVETLQFTVTSAIMSISPTAGSTLGGTTLTICCRGLPSDFSRIQVNLNTNVCTVLSVLNDTIVCALGMLRKNTPAVYEVTVLVDGVKSTCSTESGVCQWQSLSSLTPIINTDVSSLSLSTGSILTLEGTSLPAATPIVQIGTASCNVTSRSSSAVVCVVEKGVGGRHLLTVLYPVGFASHALEGCCPRVSYYFEITSIFPSKGSRFGGQRVTVTGMGFPSKISDSKVFIGGKLCEIQYINSTYLVLVTPRAADAERIGAERHALEALRLCKDYNTTAACDFSSYGLRTCQSALFSGETSPGDESANVLMISPPSDSSNLDTKFLIDSNPSTVWNSKNGENGLKIAIDLKVAKRIGGQSTCVLVHLSWC